ncbi:hypothetical protein BH24ACT15_BH24ACT15_34920 [soil metagenome]
MFSKSFLLATLERSIKTLLQSLLAFLVSSGVTNIIDVDFGTALGVSGLAALISVLTSVVSGAVTSQPGPSLVSAEVLDQSAV